MTKSKKNIYSSLENYSLTKNKIIETYICPRDYQFDPKNEKSDNNGCVKNLYATSSSTTFSPIKKKYLSKKPFVKNNSSCCNLFI